MLCLTLNYLEERKMIDFNVVNAFMTGIGIGLSYIPLWVAIVYAIDRLWNAFKPEVEI